MTSPEDLMDLMDKPSRGAPNIGLDELSKRIATSLQGQRILVDRLIAAMLEPSAVAPPPTVWHAQRNADLRAQFIQEVQVLASSDVALRAHSAARNPHALASRWRQEGKIFAVPWEGRDLYPAFQFGDDGRPYPAVSGVIATFPRRSSPWELALWWSQPNSWLDHKRPLDLLSTRPESVINAARKHFESPDAF